MGHRLQAALGKAELQRIMNMAHNACFNQTRENALYFQRENGRLVIPSEKIDKNLSRSLALFAIEVNGIIKIVLMGLLSYALPASAWLAGSFSPSTGHYHLHSEVSSKQEAIALANKGCISNSGASDCLLVTTCNGPRAVCT